MRLGIGFGLLVLAFMAMALLERTAARKLGEAGGIILIILGMLVYLFGLVDLAKAKGYESSVAAAVMFVCVLCLPIVSLFVVTPIVLFVLKDKNRRYRRHEPRRRAPTDAVPR
jgi:hypothetical protein